MRKIVITLIIILLLAVIYFLFLKRTPYTIASNITGFKVSTSLVVKQFQDDWVNNPSGDGESFVLLLFEKNEQEGLINDCKKNNYKSLPIKDTLPDNFIYRYIGKEEKSGFYKLSKDKNDERNYQIAIIDLQGRKLIVYNVIN